MTETFRVRRPAGTPILLYDTPHSGRDYPQGWHTKATGAALRQGEDAYVDELIGGAVAHGAIILEALLPRCYIDLNRTLGDIDADLLAEPWPEPLTPTDKTRRGLGLIRRYVTPGVEVNATTLSVADVQDRINRVYRPYHAALHSLVDEMVAGRGKVWHVNWHSMKSVGNAMTPDGAGAERADFVVSDRDGASAGPALTERVVGTLRGLGFRVSVNTPYKGGTIIETLGCPTAGVHSVQIEINRRLYLDEALVAKATGFGSLATTLDQLTMALVHAA